jgi:hypothetical protein
VPLEWALNGYWQCGNRYGDRFKLRSCRIALDGATMTCATSYQLWLRNAASSDPLFQQRLVTWALPGRVCIFLLWTKEGAKLLKAWTGRIIGCEERSAKCLQCGAVTWLGRVQNTYWPDLPCGQRQWALRNGHQISWGSNYVPTYISSVYIYVCIWLVDSGRQ